MAADPLGLLRIRVHRGKNLAVRDAFTSDPYVVISMGQQRLKTRVVTRSCNPVWNDELTLLIKDFDTPITLSVYDKDTFTGDDKMGDAEIDIKPYVEYLKMGFKDLPTGTKVHGVKPNKTNCLAEESSIVWENGKLVQDMSLRLRNVECGEVDIQLEWIDLPGCSGIPS